MQVPTDIDILVAGFSCVDFSNLNKSKRGLKANGESGDTFKSVLDYAASKRPRLVVLENVLNCPWEEVAEAWKAKKYEVRYIKADTKQYYIPHTRQRGYMLCIDTCKLESSSVAVVKWGKLVADFQRPASSAVEAFLLSDDDSRVHVARDELIRKIRGDEKLQRDVDWAVCQGRHQNYRAECLLGTKRPYTEWQEGGTNIFPDVGWRDWSEVQTDRVKDTMDISYLRSATRGYDLQYKM